MVSVNILLNSVERIRKFVNIIVPYPYDFDIVSGRIAIDAKSVMGIFALDISNPLLLNINTTKDEAKEVLDKLTPFIV